MRTVFPISYSLALALAATAAAAPLTAQEGSELAGTWIVSSWTAPNGEVNSEPQRGLFVFAWTRDDGGSYSIMYVLGSETRARYTGENLTDSEKLTAYDSFVANSGRYTVEGDRITYEAYMAKDPNYMGDWGGNGVNVTYTIEDEMLTLHWLDGFSEGLTATLRRPQIEN